MDQWWLWWPLLYYTSASILINATLIFLIAKYVRLRRHQNIKGLVAKKGTFLIGRLHDATKTRMLCQSAFLFKFVFSLGNKGTIGEMSLTLEATKSIHSCRGFQQNFWPTLNHLLLLQDKRLCFENTIFHFTIHFRLSLNAGRWNIRRDAFCVHYCWSRYRVFFVGSALHVVWRHQVWSFGKWIPRKRKRRLQTNNPVDSQRITESREKWINGFITRYKWERKKHWNINLLKKTDVQRINNQ